MLYIAENHLRNAQQALKHTITLLSTCLLLGT